MNAGVAGDGMLVDNPLDKVEQQVTINVGHTTYLLRLMLPSMMAREHRSAIVVTSSLSAIMPLPIIQIYGATKSYGSFIAQAVSYEAKDKIDVISYEPAHVHSNLIKEKPNHRVITAERAAQVCFRDLGYEIRTTGAFRHEVTKAWLWIFGQKMVS